jgi:hypothetical protein
MFVLDFTEHPVWRVQCLEKECTTPMLKIKLLAEKVLLSCFKMLNSAFVTNKWYNVVFINVNISKIIRDAYPKDTN